MSYLILKDNKLFHKKLGSLLGAVIGDAIGWPYESNNRRIGRSKKGSEFQDWTRRSGGKWYAHEEIIHEGEYSDDSQLIFSTARSLRYEKNWAKYLAKVELPSWLLYERGGGGATKRSAQSWSKGIPPWKNEKSVSLRYFEAGGNGVAMRILPHVLISNNKEQIFSQVFTNGINTHGHPRALLGATLYASALYYLFNKKGVLEYGELIDYLLEAKHEWSKMPVTNKMDDWLSCANKFTNGDYHSLWEKTAEELVAGLYISKEAMDLGILDNSSETLEKLGAFSNQGGAGTIAALVATYMVSKYAADPIAGFLEIATLRNADTDTLASMVGGLVGALYGTEWLREEWIEKIQDYKYIVKVAEQMGDFLEEEKDIKLWSHQENEKVKGKIKNIEKSNTIYFGPFKQIDLLESRNNKVLVKDYEIITSKFISEEGQTIFLKSINKKSPNNNQSYPSKMINQNINKEQSFSLSSIDLAELSSYFSAHIRGKRVLKLLSEILNGLENAKNNNEQFDEKFIEKFSVSFVQKGIEFNDVYKIVCFILKKGYK